MSELPSVAERRARLDARCPVWRRQTLDQAFLRAADEFADRPFVITDDVSWTYAEVATRSEAIAKGLRAFGIRPGDRVALLMANHAEFLPTAYAVWRLGATLIPVNFAFRAQELGYVLEQSQCRALITMTEFRGLDYLAMLDELSPGWEGDPGGRFGSLAAIVLFGGARAGVPTLGEVTRRGAADEVTAVPRGQGDRVPSWTALTPTLSPAGRGRQLVSWLVCQFVTRSSRPGTRSSRPSAGRRRLAGRSPLRTRRRAG